MHAINTFHTKACTKCGRLKHIESFSRSPITKDGREPWCKACKSAYQKALGNGVPVILVSERCAKCGKLKPVTDFSKRKASPRGLQKNCKDCDREYYKSKRIKAPPKAGVKRCCCCREYLPVRKFTPKKDTGLQYHCFDCGAAKSANKKAKRLGREGTVTAVEIRRKFEQFSNCCFYCGLPASENVNLRGQQNGKLDVEHMVPLSRGGPNTIDNIVPACSQCNASKHDKTADEFLNPKQENLTMPINVTAADHENEREIIRQLVELGLISRSHAHHTDDETSCFDVTDHDSKAYLELKYRPDYTIERLNALGGQYLNCDKAWAGVKAARNKNYSWRLVVLCKDGLASARLWHDGIYNPSFVSAPVNPESNCERGQALNDSCFAYEVKVQKIS